MLRLSWQQHLIHPLCCHLNCRRGDYWAAAAVVAAAAAASGARGPCHLQQPFPDGFDMMGHVGGLEQQRQLLQAIQLLEAHIAVMLQQQQQQQQVISPGAMHLPAAAAAAASGLAGPLSQRWVTGQEAPCLPERGQLVYS